MGSNRRLDGGTATTRVIEDLGKRQRNRSSAEAGDDAGDHLAQRIEMISAFQSHGESAPAETGREGRAPGQEFHITRGGHNERRERVAVVRVDPEAHENQIRPELLDDRLDDPVMSREVRSVSTPRRECDVYRESAAFSRPDVLAGRIAPPQGPPPPRGARGRTSPGARPSRDQAALRRGSGSIRYTFPDGPASLPRPSQGAPPRRR